jgi:hypothetical protein
MTKTAKFLLLKPEWRVQSSIGSDDEVNKILAESLEEILSEQDQSIGRRWNFSDSTEQFEYPEINPGLYRKINEFEWSVRSQNCLNNEKIVYLGDLVVKTETEMLRLPNLGKKSLNEIKGVLASVSLHLGMGSINWPPENIDELAGVAITADTSHSKIPNYSRQIVEQISGDLSRTSFPLLISRYPLSSRTRNFFANMTSAIDPYEITSLGYYFNHPTMWRVQLAREQNLGSKSIDEIQLFISEWLVGACRAAGLIDFEIEYVLNSVAGQQLSSIGETQFDDILRKLQQFDFEYYEKSTPDAASSLKILNIDVNESALIPEKAHVVLSSILSSRGTDVVSRRFGFFASKETLEEIASDYEITRERIRQIEAKSLRTCNLPFHRVIFKKFLLESKTDIQNILFCDGQLLSKNSLEITAQDLSGAQIFLITIGDGSLEKWLSRNYCPVEKNGQILAWATSDTFVSEYEEILMSSQTKGSVSSRLKNTIERGVWPLPLQDLATNLPDIPPALIRKTLVEEFNAKFENDKIITMVKLPAKIRLILVLRMAGQELTGSEIVGHHKVLFNTEISESVARSCLANLDEALIVGRGTYNLYENLRFSKSELANIRNQVSNYLLELGQYVSSKKLYTDLFLNHLESYSDHLTDYMLLGILQDDLRFDVRRGLMVGLSDSEFEGQFNFLNDEVWRLISEQGPLSISEIKRLLSATRDVLDTSITASLQSMDDVVADKNGNYDLANRVIGNAEVFKKIRKAVRVNLRAGPLSLFALKGRLDLVGINFPKATLRSIVMSDTLLEYGEKLVSIGDDLCPDLKEYDGIVRAATARGASKDDIEEELQKDAPHQLEYLELDAGLLFSQDTLHSNEDDYLDEIIGEFEF